MRTGASHIVSYCVYISFSAAAVSSVVTTSYSSITGRGSRGSFLCADISYCAVSVSVPITTENRREQQNRKNSM